MIPFRPITHAESPDAGARLPRIRARRGSGSVLIVVLVVCLGLVSMTLVFSHAMLLSYRGADNEIAGRQAEAAIQGAERYAETILSQAQTAHVLPDRTTYQNAAVPLGDAFFWFIGKPLASDAPGVPAFALVDEASKLNLNAASTYSLALLPNMTPDLAQAIHDWRSAAGSSGTSAIQLNPVKGAPYESPEELALVDGGVDPSVLYGDDANLNHCLDPEEGKSTGGGALGQFNPGLLEYVTTFSREPNTLSDGTKRGNVQAGIRGLSASLTAALGSTRGQAIARSFTQGGRPATFRSVVDFCVQAESRAQLTPDEWDKLAPYLTIGGASYTVGLINVNTASAAVLASLPGMTADLANQLVAARAQQATPSTNLRWVVAILGQQAGSIGRYLTTRSYQVSADVAAVGRNGRGYRRTLFVIDFSAMPITGATTPQIVYRRNLSNLGWALGGDARAGLPTAANVAAGTAKAGTTPTPKGGTTP